MTTPKTVLEKDGISAAGMMGEILAYLEEEAVREEEEERAREEGALPTEEEEEEEEGKEKITWTLAGILDHVSVIVDCQWGDHELW